MNLAFLTPDDPRWPALLAPLPHDVYHRPAYVAAEADRSDARAEAFLAQDGDRVLFVPYLVRSCASLFGGPDPAPHDATSPHGYSGVVLSPSAREPGFVAQALDGLRAGLRDRGCVSAFLRMHPILNDGDRDLFPAATTADHGPSVAVDLAGDAAAIRAQMRESQHEHVRRARRRGYLVSIEPLAGVVEPFHAMYSHTMNRVVASDAFRFPVEYFAWLATLEDVHCCVVRRDGELASACTLFECGGIVQAHLGGTFDRFLGESPFTLVLHSAALWAQSRGNRWLHLGGGVAGAEDSLLRFKSGFAKPRFRLFSLNLVADPRAYDTLVTRREHHLGCLGGLAATRFFPAYRATCPGRCPRPTAPTPERTVRELTADARSAADT